jgi:mRNA interferase RelE/StbE
MKVVFDRTFAKDISLISDKRIAENIKKIIVEFEKAGNIHELSGIKKLKGYEGYYRKRAGNYRLGFKFEKNEICFIRAKHRKDIYKVFP